MTVIITIQPVTVPILLGNANAERIFNHQIVMTAVMDTTNILSANHATATCRVLRVLVIAKQRMVTVLVKGITLVTIAIIARRDIIIFPNVYVSESFRDNILQILIEIEMSGR